MENHEVSEEISVKQDWEQKGSYKSVGNNEGFEFQKEFLIHFCFKMQQEAFENFSVGYEVRQISKFDDIVCNFQDQISECQIMIQVKNIANSKKMIKKEKLFGVSGSNPSGRNLEKQFNLKQYFKAILQFKAEGDSRDSSAKAHYFVLITNASLTDPDLQELEGYSNTWTLKVLGGIEKEGAKIQKLSEESNGICRGILEDLQQDESHDRVKIDDFEDSLDYIKKHFIIVTKSPDLKSMKKLNNRLIVKNREVINRAMCTSLIRDKISKFIKYDKVAETRNVLKRYDFINICEQCFLEVDLTSFTDAYIKEITFPVQFKDDVLEEMESFLKDNLIVCKSEESDKLTALKIFQSMKKINQNVFFVHLSKLNSQNRKAIEVFKKKTIVFVDEEEIPFAKNVFYEGKFKFSLAELTDETLSAFHEHKVKIQNVDIKLNKIKEMFSEEFLTRIFIKIVNNEKVEFGKKLPRDKIPDVYVPGKLSLVALDNLRKPCDPMILDDPNQIGTAMLGVGRCTVKGDPGMGKTSTLQKVMIDIKEAFSEYWIEFFKLGQLSKVFKSKIDSKSFDFTENEAKTFLFDKLLSYGNDQSFDQLLLEEYLKEREPMIFLAFDAFDEIMPTYDKVVLSLIQQLSKLNLNIFVTCRMHCKEVSKELENFSEIQIQNYEREQSEEFLKVYSNSKVESKSDFIMFFRELFFRDETKTFIETPLLLKLLTDIMIDEYNNPENKIDKLKEIYKNVNNFLIYDRMFRLIFEKYYEKQVIDPTRSSAILKKESELENIRKLHYAVANNEMNSIRTDYDVSEILGLGLVSRNDNGDLYFVHRTFAEYFLSCNLANEIERGNKMVMRYVTMISRTIIENYNSELLVQFVYQNLVEKIKSKNMLIVKDPNFESCEVFLEFAKSLIYFCYEHIPSDVSKVCEVIGKLLPQNAEDIFNLEIATASPWCYILYYNVGVDIGKFYNLESLLQFYRDIVNPTFSLKILDYYKKSWIQMSIEDNFQENGCLLCQILFKNGVELEEIFGFTLLILQKQIEEMPSSFFSSLEQFSLNKKDIYNFSEFENDLKKLWAFKKDCIAYTTLVFNIKLKNGFNDKLLKKFWGMAIEKGEVQNFLQKIDLKNFCGDKFQPDTPRNYLNEDAFCEKCRKNFCQRLFFQKSLMILKELKYDFLTMSGNSLFHYFWVNFAYNHFEYLLEVLEKNEVVTLLNNPYFKGKSLPDLYRANFENFEGLHLYYHYIYSEPDNILTEFQKNSSKNETWNERSLRNELRFFEHLMRYNELNFLDIFDPIMEEIYKNALSFETKNQSSVHFLHNVARTLGKSTEFVVKFLSSKSSTENEILYQNLEEKDDDGNTPLHVAALNSNWLFLEHILTAFPQNDRSSRIINLFKITNKCGQNVLHCVEDKYFVDSFFKSLNCGLWCYHYTTYRNCREIHSRISPSLLHQVDFHGKTPLHSSLCSLFSNFLMTPNDALALCAVRDQKGNNILHYLASNEYDLYSHNFIPLFNQLRYTIITTALNSKNEHEETPMDIHKRLNYNNILHWLIHNKLKRRQCLIELQSEYFYNFNWNQIQP